MCFHASAVAENPEFAGAQDQGSSSEGSSVRREWLLLHDLIVIHVVRAFVYTRGNVTTGLSCGVCVPSRTVDDARIRPARALISSLESLQKSPHTGSDRRPADTRVVCLRVGCLELSTRDNTHVSYARARISHQARSFSTKKRIYTHVSAPP
jgi:hypothetical protein